MHLWEKQLSNDIGYALHVAFIFFIAIWGFWNIFELFLPCSSTENVFKTFDLLTALDFKIHFAMLESGLNLRQPYQKFHT